MFDLVNAECLPDPMSGEKLNTFANSAVGVDTFGPWTVVTRKTRGGQAHNNRWAIIFTCLTTRGIHIELVEEMSSSSFINALHRFISLRGPVKNSVLTEVQTLLELQMI